jgi:hypothetical protein
MDSVIEVANALWHSKCNAAGHQSSFCAGWYGPYSGNMSAAREAKRVFHIAHPNVTATNTTALFTL